jgi:hypothetical protein
MIVSLIPISSSINEDLVKYVSKCSSISPVLLQMQAYDVNSIATILEIVRACQPNCMLQNVPVDMDAAVTELLDGGLLTALFNYTEEPAEVELLKKVLGTFPGNRVGINVELSLTPEIMDKIISTFSTLCCSVIFK